MPVGRSINKSYYGAMESGGKPDIEMPPINETPPIQSAQDPWSQSNPAQKQQSPFGEVPDSVPDDVSQELYGKSVSPDEIESTQDESEQEVDDIEEVEEPVQQQKKQAQESFKALREARERSDRERDEYFRKSVELELKLKQREEQELEQRRKNESIAQEEPEIDLNLDEDSLVDGKHLRAVNKKIKQLQDQIEGQRQAEQVRKQEDSIRARYPDFDKVVTTANVERLNVEQPELAAMIRNAPDLLSMASVAYSSMKQYGIHKDIYQSDKIKAQVNASKPRPLASVNPQQGDSPLSKANAFANGLTPELEKQLRKEMSDSRAY